MKYTVDRIESDYAVCYDSFNNIRNVSLDEFDFEVFEGCIFIDCDGIYKIDDIERYNLLQKINKLKERVWKKD